MTEYTDSPEPDDANTPPVEPDYPEDTDWPNPWDNNDDDNPDTDA